MSNLKSKRKISIKTIILLMCSFIMTTFAWFTYTKIVEPVLSIHMASWNIKYFIGEEEQKNADQGIQIPIGALYPGMEEQQVIVDIYNHGEVLVDIEHEIKEIVILGTKYELVPEGGAPTKENYITLLEPEITTDEETGDVIYKGPILYEPDKFPFTIELEHTTQVKPETKDAEGKKTPGQGYLRVTVNWLGDNDELDTEWGYKTGEYFTNNPEATSAMSVLVSIDSYQSADPGSITQIVLDKTTAEIRNGEEISIIATLNAGAQENLVWESSNESIATITRSEDNLTIATITGKKGGNATITAKSPDGKVKATCIVTVIQYIDNITLDKEIALVAPGSSIELTATVDKDSVDKLYWESSNENLATIEALEDSTTLSARGVITTSGDVSTIKVNGIKPGTVTITARNEDGTVKATCEITVQQLITFITLNPTVAEVEAGKATTITATVDEGAVDNITWTSSDENIATVTGSGTNNAIATITGKTKGTVTITATATNAQGTVTKTCTVTVHQYITSLSISPTTKEIAKGSSFTIKATINEGAEDSITWTSSNTSVATVTGSGTNNTTATVKGVGKGTATITAKNPDGKVKATCEVSVIILTSLGTYLPTGFSEVSAATATEGLTIADSSGNQYVWVEVPRNATVYNDLADDSEDDLNDDGTEDDKKDEDILKYDENNLTSEQLAAIETELKEYTKTYRNKTTFTDTWKSKALHGFENKDTYNAHKEKMLASVFKNQGFYVGKYETGIAYTDAKGYREYGSENNTIHPTEQTPVIQANAYPYNWVRPIQAQELASSMKSGDRTSSLLFGVQWDLVLKYMETKATNKDTIVSELNSNSTNWGNYSNNTTTNITNSRAKYAITANSWNWTDGAYGKKASATSVLLTTGASSDFGKMGIYDFAGNMYEWTLEASDSSSMGSIRGGGYNNSGSFSTASRRDNVSGDWIYNFYGFRVSIF